MRLIVMSHKQSTTYPPMIFVNAELALQRPRRKCDQSPGHSSTRFSIGGGIETELSSKEEVCFFQED